MKDKYLNDIDEFLKSDHGTAFDRTYFSRRKTGERRVSSSGTIIKGQIIRSERDRRVLSDRRRSWKKSSGDTVDATSWET